MIHQRRAKKLPPRQRAADGTTFSFWRPRKGTPGRRAAAWSAGLGATITWPDGQVEHTWGRRLNTLYRETFGYTLPSLITALEE